MADSQATLNILAIWPEWLWRTKQSPSRRNYVRAIARQPGVRLHLTGPGFPDWSDYLTAYLNVNRIMPDCHAVYGYKLSGTERGEIKGIEHLRKQCVVIEAWNECWPGTSELGGELHPGSGTAAAEAIKAGLSIMVIHHENDRPRVQEAADAGIKVLHIPHGADPIFAECARPWSERKGIVLTGSLNATHYPLRCRMHRLIQEGRIPGARYFPRPPNYTGSVEASDALVREYAQALGSFRVKLGCSSRWKYALQHYSEAALAGCAHVADLPEGVMCDFGRMVYNVDPDASDAELVEMIADANEDAESLGREAQEAAQEAFTTDHYAARLVEAIRDTLAGR